MLRSWYDSKISHSLFYVFVDDLILAMGFVKIEK